MPRPNATQADIGADVLATLAFHELLQGPTLRRALDLCGLTQDQLKTAIARRRGAGWDRLQLTDEPTRSHAEAPDETRRRSTGQRTTTPKTDYKRDPVHKRRQRPAPDGNGSELWCTGSDDDDGHFAHETEFLVRSDRPHLRVSKCNTHRLAYLRARRVTIAARDAIGEAGLKLRLDDDSNLIGIECKTCGQAFVPGDEIHGVATLEHAACAEVRP